MKRYRIVPFGTTEWTIEEQYSMKIRSYFGFRELTEWSEWEWSGSINDPMFYQTEREAENAIWVLIEGDESRRKERMTSEERKAEYPPRIFPPERLDWTS